MRQAPHKPRQRVVLARPGRRRCMLVHTRAPGFDIDAQQQDLALIRDAFDAARGRRAGRSATRLLESGPGVFAVQAATSPSVTSRGSRCWRSARGRRPAAFAYRSPRVLLLGILPVASGALAAIAAVSLDFGFVHGVTLGFGVTLIGESIDYAIYLFTQTARGDRLMTRSRASGRRLRLGALDLDRRVSAPCCSRVSSASRSSACFRLPAWSLAAGITRFILPHLMPREFFAAGAGVLARPLLAVMRHRGQRGCSWRRPCSPGWPRSPLHRGGFWDRKSCRSESRFRPPTRRWTEAAARSRHVRSALFRGVPGGKRAACA